MTKIDIIITIIFLFYIVFIESRFFFAIGGPLRASRFAQGASRFAQGASRFALRTKFEFVNYLNYFLLELYVRSNSKFRSYIIKISRVLGLNFFAYLSYQENKRTNYNFMPALRNAIKNLDSLLQTRVGSGKGFGVGIGISNSRYYSTGRFNKDNNSIIELFNNNDCFYIVVFKSNKHKLGEGVSLNLVLNSKDEKLLYEFLDIVGSFACAGKITARKNYYCLTVKDFKSIIEKIIPFLEKEIGGLSENKQKAFHYWKETASLINQGSHTTFEGLKEIKKIKLLMYNFNINEELSLVPYGTNLSSTVGYLKFSNMERSLIKIPFDKMPVFIGIILSDATLQKVNENGDARLQFKQKYGQFEYLYSVFFQLSHYCSKGPVLNKTSLQKKIFYALSFTTRSLPCITELYNLFYPGSGKKIIPNNIYDLLTWEAIAHWIQGDGTYSSGITIQTQSFTTKENVLLVNVLIIKFQLECSIQTQDKYSVIYIKSKSIKKNLHHLLPYVHPSMVYKFKGPQYKLKSKFNTIK